MIRAISGFALLVGLLYLALFVGSGNLPQPSCYCEDCERQTFNTDGHLVECYQWDE